MSGSTRVSAIAERSGARRRGRASRWLSLVILSLVVALLAVLLSASIGTFLGLVGGYTGGVLERLLMRLAEIQLAFPFIMLVVTIVAVLGPSALNVVLALGVSGWVSYTRLVRAHVLTLRELAYVESARSLGASAPR